MKKLLLVTAIAATFTGSLARAEDAAPPPPDNQIAYNVGVVTDYRYRGISQSRLKPALQGGVDYTNNPTGLYAGAWASTIKWTKDTGGGGDFELDLYAGKRGEIVEGVSYDVGTLAYVYAGNDFHSIGLPNANTGEIYGQVGYGPAYVKYSHAVTNLFGTADSKQSGYLDVGANLDLTEGYTLALHAGRQIVKNDAKNGRQASYTDWKVGVTKEFYGVTFGAAVYGTNADEGFYTLATKYNGKTGVVLSALKTF